MAVEDFETEHKKVDKEKVSRLNKRSNIFIFFGVIFLILGIGGLAVVCGMYYATKVSEFQYGIIFDAGSSHTSMYLYRWESKKYNGTGKVEEVDSCDAEGHGLTDFADNPSEAGGSLSKCLDQAASDIPYLLKPFTPVYLGATAGMRLLKIQDESASDEILQSARQEVTDSGFQVTDIDMQVNILSGQDEGIGLWVTANYAAGTLNMEIEPEWKALLPSGVEKTIGTLDLGGASTQVAYAITNETFAPKEDTNKLTLYSEQLTVFSESYLCFGAQEMRNQILAILTKEAGYEGQVNHPCFASGYQANVSYVKVFKSVCTANYTNPSKKDSHITVVGTGNNTECENIVTKLFTVSPYYTVFKGKLPERLLARGSFAYVVADLTRDNPTFLLNYTTYVDLMNEWCSKPHSNITAIDLYDPLTVCINAHYIHVLLKDIYKVPVDNWSSIWFLNKLNGISLGWSLGHMINITSELTHPTIDLYTISTGVFIVVVVITSVLIVLGIAAIVLACRFKRARYHALQQQMTPPF